MAVGYGTPELFTAALGGSGGNCAVDPPSGLASGDGWLILCYADADPGVTISASGFTAASAELINDNDAGYPCYRAFCKVAGGSESTINIVYGTGAYDVQVVSIRLTGIHATTPIGNVASVTNDTQDTATPSYPVPGLTVQADGSLVITMAAWHAVGGWSWGLDSFPSGVAQIASRGDTYGGSQYPQWIIGADSVDAGSYAPSGTWSFTNDVGNAMRNAVMQSIEIRPAASGGTVYTETATSTMAVADGLVRAGVQSARVATSSMALADGLVSALVSGEAPSRSRVRRVVRAVTAQVDSPFPLAIVGNQLVGANGVPFFFNGDTPWTIEVQLTHAQIDTYLNDRQARGFNSIIFECMEHLFSSQTPAYRNAQSGADPFTSMTDFASPNDAYWRTVDRIVNGAYARGIACIMAFAYLGYNGEASEEGWMQEVNAESDADLQAYGAFLARRYRQGNIVWMAGGDYAGTTTERDKQWQIVTGMRTVRTDQIITGHPIRADATAYSKWNGYAGFNLNAVYVPTSNIVDDRMATARGQGMPFFHLEGGYEGDGVATTATIIMGAYCSVLSGAQGHHFGNNPLWGFGEPTYCGGAGAASALSTALNTAGANAMTTFGAFFRSFEWWKLVATTDTTLVTSALGTSGTADRICPALSVDGDRAVIWVPSTNATLTVDMGAFRIPQVRARWFNPADGTYTAIGTYSNGGTRSFTASGDRLLVLDKP